MTETGFTAAEFQNSNITFSSMKALIRSLFPRLLTITLLFTSFAWSQTTGGLEDVLNQMDAAARKFQSTQANVIWNQYQKVVDETDTETGRIYFRREGGEVQMAADFVEPDKKYVIYSGGKVQI